MLVSTGTPSGCHVREGSSFPVPALGSQCLFLPEPVIADGETGHCPCSVRFTLEGGRGYMTAGTARSRHDLPFSTSSLYGREAVCLAAKSGAPRWEMQHRSHQKGQKVQSHDLCHQKPTHRLAEWRRPPCSAPRQPPQASARDCYRSVGIRSILAHNCCQCPMGQRRNRKFTREEPPWAIDVFIRLMCR